MAASAAESAGPVEDERIEDAAAASAAVPIQFGFDSHLLSMMSQVTVSGCISRCAHPIWIRQPAAVYDVTSNSVSMGAPNKKLLCIHTHTPATLSSHTPDTTKQQYTLGAIARPALPYREHCGQRVIAELLLVVMKQEQQ